MPFSREELMSMADSVARTRGIPVDLFRRLIEQESNWNPNAHSSAGAEGLTQLMPGTAHDMGVLDRSNPLASLAGGADYYKQQFDKFGSHPLALAAYNAGPGNVSKYGGVPPFEETQNYVGNILNGSAGLDESMGSGQQNLELDLPKEFIESLMARVNGAFDGVDTGQGRAEQLSGQAQQAQSNLTREQAAPLPQGNMLADTVTRAAGGVRDVIAGGNTGAESAEKLIATDRGTAIQLRAERLKLLSDTATRAADEAAKAGDTAAEMKSRKEAAKAAAQMDLMAQTLTQHNANKRSQYEQGGENKRHSERMAEERANREAQNTRASEQNTNAIAVAKVQKGINPETNEPLTLNPSSWLTSQGQAQLENGIVSEATGKNKKPNAQRLKAAYLSRYAPNKSQNLAQFLADMVNKRDPENSGKYLFEPNADGTLKPADREALKAIAKKYFAAPEDVQSIDSWAGKVRGE